VPRVAFIALFAVPLDFEVAMITPRTVRSICRRGWRLALPAGGSLVLTAALAAAAQPPAHQPVTSTPGFLNGVSAVSPSDAWAVGSGTSGPLILHWNGTSWSGVTGPNAPLCHLTGVSMDSAADGWAVGNCFPSTGEATLIEHWNGISWSRVPSPNPSPENQLFGVSMVSAADGWAVGTVVNGNEVHLPLMLHWNGTSWSRVPVSGSGGDTRLFAVSAASASDAWAIGFTKNARATLMLHWNGASWSQVPAPGPAGAAGVSDASPRNAWAVGGGTKTTTMHWNGTTWRQVFSPSPGQTCSTCLEPNELTGVAIISKSSVWSVGDYTTATGGQAALTLHWNGTRWARVPNQGGTSDSFLRGISMVSATDGWAVGGHSSPGKVLILHWNGTTWSRS
jgi:hypothetical protein